MKKYLLFIACFTIAGFLTSLAQTDGTLTFSFNQPTPTNPTGSKNVIAVWIENGSGTFIKTKMKYTNSETEHIPTWTTKSAQNVTDATTGSTRTSTTSPTAFGTKSITWNGKNVGGTTVADGIYKVWIESAWQNSAPANQHNAIISFSFTKGATSVHLTPTGDTYFNTITLDWVPATTSIEIESEIPALVAYPNPTSGILNIDYYKATNIQIINILGSVVYNEKTDNLSGDKTIDMRNFSEGIYFINVMNGNKSTKYKVILDK